MKTIQELREARGESRLELAAVVNLTPETVAEWEQGLASPSVTSLRALCEHFGVGEEEIDLEPNRPPSLGEELVDALDG
jgi:transcriptional regulator with XRE-family HTH domain